MFPLKEDVPSRRFPVVTLMTIIAFGALRCSVIKVNPFDRHYQKEVLSWVDQFLPRGET